MRGNSTEGDPVMSKTSDVLWSRLITTHNFVFIDGASASGKSTIKDRLLAMPEFGFEYAKRYTTRQPRPDDRISEDYLFVSQEFFDSEKADGEFVEYRDFKFGMSYGISKKELVRSAGRSKNVITLMNLGKIGMVKDNLPTVTSILVLVSLKSLETRLLVRGSSTPEQIEERLSNARLAFDIQGKYDLVCSNDDGQLDSAVHQVASFLRSKGFSK